jgi:hypothetical protein
MTLAHVEVERSIKTVVVNSDKIRLFIEPQSVEKWKLINLNPGLEIF